MFQLPATSSEHRDLEQLKRQAKELLKAYKARERLALDLVGRHQSQAHPEGFNLASAQLVIARHHGFPSWAKLRAHVERVHLGRLIKAVQTGDRGTAQHLLRQRPELVHLDTAENNEHRALHYAVLRRDEPMVRLLMGSGADAHQGIFPHRDATTAYILAKERGFNEIVAAIREAEEARCRTGNPANPGSSTLLFEHLRQGRETATLTLLNEDPGLLHATDRHGETPLHLACEAGALKVIDWLLKNQANPHQQDTKGRTPLDYAINRVHWKAPERRFEFPPISRRLLQSSTEIPPRVAAALGNLEILRALNPANWKDADLLSTAVHFRQIEAVKCLLDLGFDPNEKGNLPNLDDEVITQGQPLWLAAAFGEHAIARLLLERGADPMGEVYAAGNPVERAYATGDKAMQQLLADHGGKPSALCIGGVREIAAAKKLLEANPSEIIVRDLLWASACAGSPEIIKMCLPKVRWKPDDSRWHSILVQPLRIHLHSPVSERPEFFDRSTYPECLRLLLAHDIDLRVQGRYGATLMHYIAAEGKCWGVDVMTTEERLAFARITLEARPDLTLRDELLRSTPLGWACRWGRVELVELLLEQGCPAQEPEAESWATPLAWAIRTHHAEIESLLRKKGATR